MNPKELHEYLDKILVFAELKVEPPKAGESKEDFLSRCIPGEINAGHPDKEAQAICYSYWENK